MRKVVAAIGQHTRATRIGHIAHNQLGVQSNGVVFAVFKNTFYLKIIHSTAHAVAEDSCHSDTTSPNSLTTKNHQPLLCCVGQATLPAGPLNVSTTLCNLPDLPRLQVGEVWQSNEQNLTIGHTRLDMSQATIWYPPRKEPVAHPLHPDATPLAQLVEDIAPPRQSSSSSLDSAITTRLSQTMTQLRRWLIEGSRQETTAAFPNGMIGCGGGLTPAGDDILAGVMVALHRWNKPLATQLAGEVKKHLSSTSEISAAHLLCACSGSAIETLHNLIDALGPGDNAEAERTARIEETARTLCHYGHSSGYFAMQGVLLAAELRKDTGSNKQDDY